MKSFIIIAITICCISCNKKKIFDGPSAYSDGFEEYDTSFQMIEVENKYWSFFQITKKLNNLSIDSSFRHSGKKAIKCLAEKSDDIVSKCSFSKQKMTFWEGETMVSEAWYYIQGDKPMEWLFLMDLEEQTAIGAGPGMRLALVENKIRVEHKYLNKDIIQPTGSEHTFIRNKWNKLRFETLLSKEKNGWVKVYQNDTLILHQENWNTLPHDILYFQQGTKGMYSSVEFGITANTHNNEVTLYVDDIQVSKAK